MTERNVLEALAVIAAVSGCFGYYNFKTHERITVERIALELVQDDDEWFKMMNITPPITQTNGLPGEFLPNFDFHRTNIVIYSTHNPGISKSNNIWLITFP